MEVSQINIKINIKQNAFDINIIQHTMNAITDGITH